MSRLPVSSDLKSGNIYLLPSSSSEGEAPAASSSPGRLRKNRNSSSFCSSGYATLFALLFLLLPSSYRIMSALPQMSSAAGTYSEASVQESVNRVAKSVSDNVAGALQTASESLFGGTHSGDDDDDDDDDENPKPRQTTLTLIPKPAHVRIDQPANKFVLTDATRLILVTDNDNNNNDNNLLQTEAELLAETVRMATGYQLPIVENQACGSSSATTPCICLELLTEKAAKAAAKTASTTARTRGTNPNSPKQKVLLQPEGYVLQVQPTLVQVQATTSKGIFYATQTILQLLPPQIYAAQADQFAKTHPIQMATATKRNNQGRTFQRTTTRWTLPCLTIHDAPRFAWRGMHMDVSRHFWPKSFVLKFINALALHKMNSFHWHLTDDQGWRLEIPQYPKLQTISAWRNQTLVGHHDREKYRPTYDGTPHGGYYTQDDIREVVEFARKRHVNIVPEIEMPGHTQAVLAAYPELGCRPDLDYHVRQVWAVSNDVYCAGNEATFRFLEHVLTEVMKLFPHSQYIHVGGDECPKMRWRSCSKCRARIKEEGLRSAEELQAYFMQRIGRFLQQHGRRMIGWDEILDGGLKDKNSTIMSWRGMDPGFRAIQQGHDTIMAPGEYTYMDAYQTGDTTQEPLAIGGNLPLEKVYSFDPFIPPKNSPFYRERHNHNHDDDQDHKHGRILGAQGQLWSEYFPTTDHVEYMAFPRLTALAEVLWMPQRSNTEETGYANFYHRLTSPVAGHLQRLEACRLNYRDPRKDEEKGQAVET